MEESELKVLLVGVEACECAGAFAATLPHAAVDAALSAAEALTHLELLVRSAADGPLYDAVVVDAAALEVLPHLGAAVPSAAVVALCAPGDGARTLEALELGADGVLPKTPTFQLHAPEYVRLHVHRRRLLSEVDRWRRAMAEAAERDELTGLYNRLHFMAALDLEIERARRSHRPATLVIFDVDALKLVNDTHGHEAGDAALRHVGARLRDEVRRFETSARVGDDEFAVLLVDTGHDGGRQVAEKLRHAVAGKPVPPIGQVTVSAGVASVPAHAETSGELLRAAGHALEEAKRAGRNRVALNRGVRRERAGERHPIRIKLIVKGRDSRGEPFSEETETELLSRRGARVVATHAVAAGEQIRLHSPFHPQPLTAQVTACYRGEDGRWRLGFKLVDPPRWGA